MKLFGYSISLNVLILIGILYLIMVVNALSGTCNREGMSSAEAAALNAKHMSRMNDIDSILINSPLSTPDLYLAFKNEADIIYATNPTEEVKRKAKDLSNNIAGYVKRAQEEDARKQYQKAIDDQKAIDAQKAIEDARIAAIGRPVNPQMTGTAAPELAYQPSEPQRDKKRRWR